VWCQGWVVGWALRPRGRCPGGCLEGQFHRWQGQRGRALATVCVYLCVCVFVGVRVVCVRVCVHRIVLGTGLSCCEWLNGLRPTHSVRVLLCALRPGDALLRCASLGGGLHLLWRLMHSAKGVVQAAFTGLAPETLDLLTRRWDDLDAVPGSGSDNVNDTEGGGTRVDDGGSSSCAQGGVPGASPSLFCAGCVVQLRFGHGRARAEGVQSGEPWSGPPSTPDFFQAFYNEVDADVTMAAVSGHGDRSWALRWGKLMVPCTVPNMCCVVLCACGAILGSRSRQLRPPSHARCF
jgi:hypothetical protein